MAKIIKKNLNNAPDETRAFEKGKVEIASLDDVTIGRAEFDPGWSWAVSYTHLTLPTNREV